jgi:hypothetical protein
MIAAAALACVLGEPGCGRDAQVEAFLELHATTTGDIEKAFRAAKATEAEAAGLRVLQVRGPQLRERYVRVRDVRGFQLSEEVKRRFAKALGDDLERVCGLGSLRLCEDFKAIVR